MSRWSSTSFVVLAVTICACDGAPTPRTMPGMRAGDTATEEEGDDSGVAAAGCRVFPEDNPWNQPVGGLDVHASSDGWLASIEEDATFGMHFGPETGIPVNVVTDETPWVDVSVYFEENSDLGAYPLGEGFAFEVASGQVRQRRLVAWDPEACQLYELFNGEHPSGGAWSAVQALRYDLDSNALHERGWRSSSADDPPGPVPDGSGLPLFPGLVRVDEVAAGRIEHALRFRVRTSRRAFIEPAVWAASDRSEARFPRMGARFRLRADVDCGAMPEQAAVVCTALQEYGMLLGENGDAFALEGELDSRWDPAALAALSTLTAGDFEAVYTGDITAY